jgi:hypothetical protein
MEDKIKTASQHSHDQGVTTGDYRAPDGTPVIDEPKSPAPLWLTISLTDRAPVKIDRNLWPVIASADDHDGKVECQANRRWKLLVREHDDGRSIVYGIYTTNWQNEHDRRGGALVDKGGNIAAAIRSVGDRLGFTEDLIQSCIADLPAESL